MKLKEGGSGLAYLHAFDPVHVKMFWHGGHPLSLGQPEEHPILRGQPHVEFSKILHGQLRLMDDGWMDRCWVKICIHHLGRFSRYR